MDKANVMEALDCCLTGSCWGCPYHDDMQESANCDQHLLTDVLDLLKAEEKDPPLKYEVAYIYTKETNLLPWLDRRYPKYRDAAEAARMRAEYAKEREVELILLVRYEGNKSICRIRCPINPLPIKGDFQCVSASEMSKLLASMGWKYKEKIYSGMFQAK